jgi:cytochrome c-type biogenesis protein CcmH
MGDAPRTERLAQAQALRDARPSQAEAETAALQEFPPPTVEPPEDVAAAIERLRGAALQDELGLEDWALLSALEARLGRYADAARAQAQVVAIRGEAASVEDLVRLADLRVAAAGAVVTEETELILAEIHARDPGNLATQLYMGLLDDQTGRPDLAFPRLRRVVEEAQPGSLHWQLAAGRIADVAALAGVDYQPPAAERTPEDMVEGLASRLASQGGTAEEWARLITSLGVLGETERAAAILGEARNVFADDEGALRALDEAARSAGLSE